MAATFALLAVDDEPMILDLLRAHLGPEFHVFTANDTAAARTILASETIDVVLTDQHLRDFSPQAETGGQLLEWLRFHRPKAIRILMTGQAMVEDAVDAINKGRVHRFLMKPFELDRLREILLETTRSLQLERNHDRLLEELRQLNQELEQRVAQRTHELEEANRQLQYKNFILEKMALTDALTGLPNRRAMDRLIRTELQRRARHPAPMSLLIADVDHFKSINTQFLLPGGDHALIWLGQVLAKTLRAEDSVGRLGGEEFIVLAPDTGVEGASRLAERLRLSVANDRTSYLERTINMTISIGAAVTDPNTPATMEELMTVAAQSLAEAKEAGRNRIVVRAWPGNEMLPRLAEGY